MRGLSQTLKAGTISNAEIEDCVASVVQRAYKTLRDKRLNKKNGGGNNSYPQLNAHPVSRNYPTAKSRQNIQTAISNQHFDSQFADFLLHKAEAKGIRCKGQ